MHSSKEAEEELVSSEDEVEGPICRLSQPAHPHTLSRRTNIKPAHPHTLSRRSLFRRNKIKPSGICFTDGENLRAEDEFYYYCTTCDVAFHNFCYKDPRKMTHPYHPQHPLTLCVQSRYSELVYESNKYKSYDEECMGVSIPNPGNIFDNCTWCGGRMISLLGKVFYQCFICNFCLCLNCSKTFPFPTKKNPKTHHHSLIFLPRPLLLPCDACGLLEKVDPSYACFQCNFVVHESCIDLPHIIKLTRHPHRLFYTPFLSPTISFCRLCYKTVDVKYGHYSCNLDDCSYVLHSKCATHKQIWDGRELEWEPEEFGEAEDVAPFKKVGDDLIKYFCHEHHLKLEKYDGVRDADKKCQACILQIDSRDFYNCEQCEFFLHEVCANLPRKLDHALHNHPLFLDPSPPQEFRTRGCSVCSRGFAGFKYKCSKNNCEAADRFNPQKFQVDVGCILVPDCFTHKSHEHPLFTPIFGGKYKGILCRGCKAYCGCYYLQCTLCQYAICYRCATMPDKLHYKYDALPLSLCYGEVSDETYWCEVCEKKLVLKEWFYTCNKTCITIHRECVFGHFAYMKPGYTFYYKSFSMEIICNDSNTRPICHKCNSRCWSSVYLWFDERVLCSFFCLTFAVRRRDRIS